VTLKVLAVLLVLVCSAAGAEERTLREVRVRGTLRVEPGLVLQKISSKAGEPYDPARVRQDLQNIYALQYFENIVVELDEDGVLTFVVLERPALREWSVEGADELDEEDVEKAVPLKRREILDRAQVEAGARAIRDLYREKGFFLVEVKSEIATVPDGKNHVDVTYRVTEGEKVRVKDVNLLGVEQVDVEEVRDIMATRQAGLWSFLTGSGKFKDADLKRDREVIRAYYLNHGFIEAEVREPLVNLTRDRKWLKVDIPVVEGESFRVASVTFAGDLEFTEAELTATAGLVEGDTFRSDDFRQATQQLTDRYADVGYAFAEVEPRTRVDPESRTVAIEFQVHKGDPVHVGRIEVRGNTKTRDRIVRREMRLNEGDLYSSSALRKSRKKIEALGFFEKVNLTTHRRPGTNLVDIDIEVEEKATGSFSIGVGYSSQDSILFMGSVNQRNFLGLGYQLAANVNFGSSKESYSLTFNNPRVFDTLWYAGIDLYKTTNEYTDYDKDALGGALKLGTALGEHWRTRWIYRLEEADVKNVDYDASLVILDQEGRSTTSSITPVLTYDSRDNPWEPSSGMEAELSVEWAGGILQGDNDYFKYILDVSKYFPLWWKHVFMIHGNIGFLQALHGDNFPLYERFVLGGINTLRGFDNRSIGPKAPRYQRNPDTGDIVYDSDGNPIVVGEDVIGGDKQILFNLEYIFPISQEIKLKGVVFFDAGNAWDFGQAYFDTALRRSVGAGVRWFSPMGPLRLEWGYVLDRKDDEEQAQWEFSVGGFF
jgi:outer membrane protein insertion porin family